MVKIALDAGHGIHTAGKRTPDGEREWYFNDKVLRACVVKLNTYHGVEVKRLDDPTGQTDVPLSARTNTANFWKADVLVSIHHNANSGKWGTHSGVETYVQPGANKASTDIANIINPLIVKAMGLSNRGVKVMNLHMTRESNMPAILTEGGFLDSTVDIHVLRSDAKLKAQGEAIAKGLAVYFKLKSKANKPQPDRPKEDDKLDLSQSQLNDLANVFKDAREKGIFSSSEHETEVKAGKMSVSKATYLVGLIASAALNDGIRIK